MALRKMDQSASEVSILKVSSLISRIFMENAMGLEFLSLVWSSGNTSGAKFHCKNGYCCIGTYRTLSRARLHFGPCYWSIFVKVYLKEFFFHFGESRALKGVIFFHSWNFEKGVFVKKNIKKIKAVLRETRIPLFAFGSAPSDVGNWANLEGCLFSTNDLWWFVCSHSPCVDARQFLTNPFGKHQICWRMFVRYMYMPLHNQLVVGR